MNKYLFIKVKKIFVQMLESNYNILLINNFFYIYYFKTKKIFTNQSILGRITVRLFIYVGLFPIKYTV